MILRDVTVYCIHNTSLIQKHSKCQLPSPSFYKTCSQNHMFRSGLAYYRRARFTTQFMIHLQKGLAQQSIVTPPVESLLSKVTSITRINQLFLVSIDTIDGCCRKCIHNISFIVPKPSISHEFESIYIHSRGQATLFQPNCDNFQYLSTTSERKKKSFQHRQEMND